MAPTTKRTPPSQNRKLHPPPCRLRKPDTMSRPEALSPALSLPQKVGATRRWFIASSRGSGARPYCAVTAKTEPYQGWLESLVAAAAQDCSMTAGLPVTALMAGCDGLLG